MKNIFRILAIGGIFAATAVANAQNTNSGYFLDGYTYRYQLNPAFEGSRGFVSFPALGNINESINGNLGLENLIFDYNGETVLFTNPNISTAEVLDGFPDNAKITENLKLNIMSFGFKGFGGYNALSINARMNVGIGLPSSLIKLAKEGLSNKTYDVSNIKANANAFVEIGLTHSRDIKQVPGLRAGVTLKGLVGAGYMDAYFNTAHLTLNNNDWYAETDAEIYAAAPKLQLETDVTDAGKEYVSGMNFDGDGGYKPQGYGFAIDLGATYEWTDFTFSAALLDLGFISYSDTHYATTHGLRGVHTNAFTFSVDENATNSFEDELDRLADDLESLYQLSNEGIIGSRKVGLGATLNLGAEYTLPMYKALSVGLLSSTKFGKFGWTEARLSANYAPCSFFSMTANTSVGTYGTNFGWMLSLHPKVINFFVGMDYLMTKVSKQYVPLKSNASVNLGLNVTF